MDNNANERRAMLALLLSIAVYFVWTTFIMPPPQPPVELPAETPATPVADTDPVTAPAPTPAPAVVVPDRTVSLSMKDFQGEVRSIDGAARSIDLRDYTAAPEVTPIYSWVFGLITGSSETEGGWQPYAGGDEPYEMLSEEGAVVLAGAGSLAPAQGYLLEERDGALIATHTDPGAGLTITKEYRQGAQPYTMDVTVTFQNGSSQAVPVWVGIAEAMSGDAGRFQNAVRPVAYVDGGIEHFDDLEDLEGDGVETRQEALAWYGISDRYFMTVLRPTEADLNTLVVDQLPDGRYGSFAQSQLDAGGTKTLAFQAYIGPKQLDILEEISPEMGEAVELGWFGFFARILLFLLKIFQAGVVNWGIAILLLTLLVKVLFFPLTQRSFKSSRKMQAIQPQLQAIREKYKDNQQLQQQETMKLFSEHGVNPVSGCLPMLIQLPVFLALYNVMLYSVELYDSSFLYLQDLTVEDPYGVLPIAYAVLILGQQSMMPMGNMDPTQRQVMRLMPLMFAAFMFTFPSGLVLYFCCNILLTIGQQWLINRSIKVEAPANA
ncbi:MAG: membrane protein insertase YidC [Myxococcota bacterium]